MRKFPIYYWVYISEFHDKTEWQMKSQKESREKLSRSNRKVCGTES
jgi:hypothetical protein